MMKERVYIKLEMLIESQVERYCSGCKQKVIFKDSLVRRNNANGKKIYQYAIYKCERGHTWNKMLDHLDASVASTIDYETREQHPYKSSDEYITLDLIENRIIEIQSEGKKMRLDKLLHKITDKTRREINELIEKHLYINGHQIDGKYKVKNGDIIEMRGDIC